MEPAATGAPNTARLPDVTSLINIPAMLSSAMMKVKRSNSWSYEDFSFEDYRFAEDSDPKERAAETERKQHENFCRLLDPTNYLHYDVYLKVYANILYRWGLRNQSAGILKHVTIPPEGHSGIEFGVKCHYCGNHVRGAKCETCKWQAFQCVICHTGVKGASNFCLNCGHGGHTKHLLDWFKTEQLCPTGCGCKCLKMNPF